MSCKWLPLMLRQTAVYRNPVPQRRNANGSTSAVQGPREDPQNQPNSRGNHYPIAARAAVAALKAHTALSNAEIEKIVGIQEREIRNVMARARERGFDGSSFRDEFFKDKEGGGRRAKATEGAAATVKEFISQSRNTRSLTCATIARQLLHLKISPMSIWRILRSQGYSKVKPTRKPGLTKDMKAKRLAWCLAHKDWTLDDWRKVLWSDETSVVYGQRRGGERVWRTSYEPYEKSVLRNRFKGFSEFMFWGCFSYDYRGPCHVYQTESAAQKAAALHDLQQRNASIEATTRNDWELAQAARRHLNVHNARAKGKEPQWRFTKETGKLVREHKKDGIDWYRYQQEVLKPKMLPFAKQHNLIVQEDGAPAHKHGNNISLYNLFEVTRLLWPGNSPDLNMIEPCWYWIKRRTQLHRDFEKRPELRAIWQETWNSLPQPLIQRWIRRIIRHIQEVIKLEGGNEYREGSEDTPCEERARTFDKRAIDRASDNERLQRITREQARLAKEIQQDQEQSKKQEQQLIQRNERTRLRRLAAKQTALKATQNEAPLQSSSTPVLQGEVAAILQRQEALKEAQRLKKNAYQRDLRARKKAQRL